MTVNDLQWLFAAYKKDGFGPLFAPDMTAAEFRDEAAAFLRRQQHSWLIVAPSSRGMIPVGLVIGSSEGHRLFPHAIWFPWATARNRLEGIIAYLRDATDQGMLVVIPSGTKFLPFFTKLMRYGILRRCGPIPGWFAENDAADQSVEGAGTTAMFFYAWKK